jgi:hypothetical protein
MQHITIIIGIQKNNKKYGQFIKFYRF